ncbi:LIM domain kinase 1-like [Aplysia californica]|uniref:LIM domain kinase 1-like n=1 Tax=Aplysia californica TaxID=6500 RepID=A0ABM0JNK0_APLCA|nr:LIM domain kinase 1-like [Aplysia californica]
MDAVEQHDAFFNSFNLVRGPCLGSGAVGEVVLASAKHNSSLKVAVKIVTFETEGCKDDFLCEVGFLRDLHHPRILKMIAFDMDDHHGFMLSTYFKNGTLRDTMSSDPPVEEPRILRHILDVASALQYIHGLHIFHQDVKPRNILLDDQDRAVLADFGLATQASDSSAMVMRWETTPGYYGPETRKRRPMSPFKLKYAGRDVLGTPAVGIGELHKQESVTEVARRSMDAVEQHDAFFNSFNLVRGPCLGSGAVGEVVLASAKHNSSLKVAVKIVTFETEGCKDDFLCEVGFLRDLRHPRILKMIAFAMDDHHGFMLSTYFKNGTLRDTMSWHELTGSH